MFTLRISVPRNYQPRGRRYGTFHQSSNATNPSNTTASPASPQVQDQNNLNHRVKQLILPVIAMLTFLSPQARAQSIWISPNEIATLPTSGPAWDRLKAEADGPTGTPNLSDQEDAVNVQILAKALVFARTKDERYRSEVIYACMIAIDTEKNGSALALGRKLAAYVIAADLVGLPPNENQRFRAWLNKTLTEPLGGLSLRSAHEKRANNWGTHAGASRVAVAAYLGDQAEIARCAQVFKGWLGDRASYAGFQYGNLSWQADPSQPVGINPKGVIRDGHLIDGVLPDDQRRGGIFKWPPPKVNYVYGALQGALVQAVILSRLGYEVWNWQDRALLRAYQWLHSQANFAATGDDTWQLHLVNYYYRTQFPALIPSPPGKNIGWTDWTHGSDNRIEDDVAGINITESDGSTKVAESGANDAFTIALNSVPSENVDLTVDPDDQLDLGAGAGKPIVLTFTPATALTPQTVTVSAVDDAVVEGSHNGTIVYSAASSDANYNGISIASVADITDNDAAMPQLVFLADELIKINCNGRSEGAIHCNGKIEFGKSQAGIQNGNLTAVDKITIAENNQIVGDVVSGAYILLLGNTTITGTKTVAARVAKIPLPSLSYSAGGADETVPAKSILSLEPGSYDKIEVSPKSTLILNTGNYYFNILDTERSARLSIDVSKGPVNINIVEELDFDESVQVEVFGGSTDLVTFSTLQTFKVDVGKKAIIRGTLNAPEAEVHFATGCAFKGELRAKAISLDPQVQFVHHNSTLPFLKEAEVLESEVAKSEVAGDQLAVTSYQLEQNYPNPFSRGARALAPSGGNPGTTISFNLPRAGETTLMIYNTTGQLVRRLVAGYYRSGRHQVRWDATDNHGAPVASGTYLYVLQAGDPSAGSGQGFVAKKKLLLMK